MDDRLATFSFSFGKIFQRTGEWCVKDIFIQFFLFGTVGRLIVTIADEPVGMLNWTRLRLWR